MKSKKILINILLLLAILLCAGCSSNSEKQNSESSPAEENVAGSSETSSEIEEVEGATEVEQDSGGNLTIALSQEPDKICSYWSALAVSKYAYLLTNDTILKYDENEELVPALASEVPSVENGGISEDGTTYTIKLREDITWQDGEVFNAEDVVFTFNVISNPDYSALYPQTFASVESLDEFTVVATFANTDVTFLTDLAEMPVLPEHILKDVTDWTNIDYFSNPYPGTGPFVFSSWERGSHIVFEKNENYYAGGPKLDKIFMRFISNPDATLTAVESGEVDMTFTIIGEHVPLYQNLNNVEVYETPSYSAFFVIFNVRNPLLKDVTTRKALNYAVDREGILNTVVKGLGTLKWSPIPNPSWAWVDVTTKYPYDVEKAKSLLEEAGWMDEDGDGIREAHGVEGIEDGTLFAWTLNNITGETERLQVCQILQEQWKEIGAEVEINTTDVSNYVAINNAGEYAMSYGYLTFNADPSTAAFWYKTEDALNWHGLEEAYPGLQALLLSAEQTVIQAERKAMYSEFQELIADGATDLFVYDRYFYHVANKRIHEFKPTAAGGMLWNVNDWWVE